MRYQWLSLPRQQKYTALCDVLSLTLAQNFIRTVAWSSILQGRSDVRMLIDALSTLKEYLRLAYPGRNRTGCQRKRPYGLSLRRTHRDTGHNPNGENSLHRQDAYDRRP